MKQQDRSLYSRVNTPDDYRMPRVVDDGIVAGDVYYSAVTKEWRVSDGEDALLYIKRDGSGFIVKEIV